MTASGPAEMGGGSQPATAKGAKRSSGLEGSGGMKLWCFLVHSKAIQKSPVDPVAEALSYSECFFAYFC